MIKKITFICTLLIAFCSCKKNKTDIVEQNGYVISLSIDGLNNRKVSLHKFSSETSNIVDSTIITNNNAVFEGVIEFPERYLITIETIFGGKLFIIENDSIQINATKYDLVNSIISGSDLNDELSRFQKKINKIYNKVDVLFPEIQRARLANDAVKLSEISKKMQSIEQESIDYSFNYATNNNDSFVSVMILNDLSKRDVIDTKRIESVFNGLTKKVKKSIDSKELNSYIQDSYR